LLLGLRSRARRSDQSAGRLAELEAGALELAGELRDFVVVELELGGERLELCGIDEPALLGALDDGTDLIRLEQIVELVLRQRSLSPFVLLRLPASLLTLGGKSSGYHLRPGVPPLPTRPDRSNAARGKCIPRVDPIREHRTTTGRRSLWRTVQEALRRRPPRFAGGPFARRSASSSTARSSVTVSGSSPLRRLALVSPSVTYGPKRPSLSTISRPPAGSVPISRNGFVAARWPRRCRGCARRASAAGRSMVKSCSSDSSERDSFPCWTKGP